MSCWIRSSVITLLGGMLLGGISGCNSGDEGTDRRHDSTGITPAGSRKVGSELGPVRLPIRGRKTTHPSPHRRARSTRNN